MVNCGVACTEGRPGLSLDDLLEPCGRALFFSRHYQRRWLHLPGAGAPNRILLDGAGLERALNAESPASAGGSAADGDEPAGVSGNLRFYEERRRGSELHDYLGAGLPVVWDGVRGLAEAVDGTRAGLAEAFGAEVWVNLYWTGIGGAPLPMHFDPHDVLVVQCEGEKHWRISSLVVGLPLDRLEMRAVNQSALEAGRSVAAGRVEAELVTRPGDVLYLPRGTFHAASTLAGRSLHLTFGIAPPSGVDLVDALANLAIADPVFRRYLPAPASDPGGDQTRAAIDEMRGRLRDLIDADELADEFTALRGRLRDR